MVVDTPFVLAMRRAAKVENLRMELTSALFWASPAPFLYLGFILPPIQAATARQFVAFLKSAEGHAIFRRNGWE
jgi:ABC-type molybdate transport system substrate-binding protein